MTSQVVPRARFAARLAAPVIGVLAATVVSVWALSAGGAVVIETQPGLPPRDPLVTWLVPMLKLGHELLAAGTVGATVAAAFLVDGENGRIGARAWRWLRGAGWAGLVWTVVALAQAAANLADIIAQPLSFVTPTNFISYLSTEAGFAYAITAGFAMLAAVIALNALSVNGAAWAAVCAAAATLPQVFNGHTAAAGDHQIAVDSMLLHVLGAVLWVGGLFALLLARKFAPVAARRYSRLALVCFIAVGASGTINAAVRFDNDWGQLFTTAYGFEVLGKTVGLVLLGGFGLWHRRVTLPRLESRPALFRRFALVEIAVMAGTFGLAVALSRTPSPEGEAPEDSAEALLGFPMPEPLSPKTLLSNWYPELLVCACALAAVGLYLAAVVRLYRRGDSWPITRTGLWVLGWGVAVFVTSSGMSKYGMVLFSVHMVQHMTLNMLVPILLVLAAPITLALRALKPAERGPREWLLAILHSRVVTFVSQPLIALGIYAFSLYMMYFTGLFEWAMRTHPGHLYMLFHFLAAGSLFYWVIIGPDPSPRQIPYPAKILLYFIALVFHTIFGLTVMQSTEVIAAGWFDAFARDWGPSLMEDQQAGGGIAWAFGEPPSLIVLGALLWQWSRSEDRAARRADRVSDRAQQAGRPEDDPHERYNAYLAELADADRKAGLRDD